MLLPRTARRAALVFSVTLASWACHEGTAVPRDSSLDETRGPLDASEDVGDGFRFFEDDATDAARLPDAREGPDGGSGEPVRYFDDMTAESGVAMEREPLNDDLVLADRMSGGVCVLDVDGNAPLDLFFAVRPTRAGHGSRLYVGRAPWRYSDETRERGLAAVGDAWGCLAWDEDGDGDDDLLVYGVGLVTLWINEGGAFVEAHDRIAWSPRRTEAIAAAAAGDLDGDGDLDLVLGGFLDLDASRAPPADCGIPGHRCIPNLYSIRPLPNALLVRDADGVYRDATRALAPGLLRAEATLALGVSDLDADGRLDIFVCNDLGSRDLDRPFVRGADGVFRDASRTLGLSVSARGYGTDCMGWSSYDIDGNGRFDHVVSDFEGQPTSVHFCGTDGFCEDVSRKTGTEAWARETFRWGAALVDLDADGFVELLEATGHVYAQREIEAIGFRSAELQPMHLASWTGEGWVVPRRADDDGSLAPRASRGIAVADLDDDGAPDVVLAPSFGRPALLRNVAPRRGRRLAVRLVGRGLDREAAGAVVEVEVSTGTFRRERHVGEGYAGNFDRRLFFGLGEAVGEARVRVRWPSGEREEQTTPLDREVRFVQRL